MRSRRSTTNKIHLIIMIAISSIALSSTTVLSKQFQKTDASLLYEIDTNLNQYDSSGAYKKTKPKKPPRIRRFEIAKKGIHKLIYKNALPNSLLGGVIGALATATPTGLVLGGLAGTLQGKSDRYEEAQGKIHLMEREIFSSEPYALTEEEKRLALFTGADLSEFTQRPQNDGSIDIAKVATDQTPQNKQQPTGNATISGVGTEKVIEFATQLPPPDVDYCHDLTMGNTKPLDNKTRRELVSFCFYHLN